MELFSVYLGSVRLPGPGLGGGASVDSYGAPKPITGGGSAERVGFLSWTKTLTYEIYSLQSSFKSHFAWQIRTSMRGLFLFLWQTM
jgi:hypothetical protein